MKLRPKAALAALAASTTLLVPTTALAQDPENPGGGDQPPAEVKPKPAKLNVKLKGVKNGNAKLGERIGIIGTVTPFVEAARVEVRLIKNGDTVLERTPRIQQVQGKNFGRFKLRTKPLMEAGKYRVRVKKEATEAQEGGQGDSGVFKLRFPDLDPGDKGPEVKLFNELLRKQGYFNTDKSKYGSHTERAVMAFRKVNGMARNFQATPQIFEMLAAGKGAFKLKYPGAGKHVEVDISRQVMALADDGKAKYVFHVSTGAAATPSDPGGFRFYRREPGFNSLGMYYSVYYNRGEAIHGYKSVPPSPASHGCIRNPIPDSKFIYDWVSIGDRIWVYH